MDANPRLLALTRALADPLRLAVLHRLMTGPATVSELMAVVGAEQSRLSNHLALLRERRLVRTTRQGRHVIYELHDAAVGTLVEALGQIGGASPRTVKSVAIAHARTCYDHLAGRLGVAITDALVARDAVVFEEEGGQLTEQGERFLRDLGIVLPARPPGLRRSARPVCRPCLDWSERRPHVAGQVGAAICRHCFDKGWIRRLKETRALSITPKGHQQLRERFGVSLYHA